MFKALGSIPSTARKNSIKWEKILETKLSNWHKKKVANLNNFSN
jgi:hypothetical protein